jgi:hypothetical protein
MSPIPGTEQTPPAGAAGWVTAVVLAVPVVLLVEAVPVVLAVPVVEAVPALPVVLVEEAVLAVLLAPRTLAEANEPAA